MRGVSFVVNYIHFDVSELIFNILTSVKAHTSLLLLNKVCYYWTIKRWYDTVLVLNAR